jgi:hypothetical protein
MILEGDFKKAQFTYQGTDGSTQIVPVDFNPSALEYSITLNTQGEGGKTQQAASRASAKLNLELVFDSTDTGEDVRNKTNKVELMLGPPNKSAAKGAPPPAPPMVTFEWGAFKFQGVVDSFKQSMDFFSANGVPLRAAVSLSMAQPEYQFDQKGGGATAAVAGTMVLPDGDASSLAAAGGDPGAARGIAGANGLESLRASAGFEVSVGAGVSIGAAAGFAAGGGANAGLGADFGFGAGARAGLGLGVAAGVGVGAGVSGGFAAGFGGSASASVSATDGAFAGLHTSGGPGAARYFEAERLFAGASAPGVGTGAVFDVTGRAVAQAVSSFQADVGTGRGLRFDES